MQEIYIKEEQVIVHAEELLGQNRFSSEEDEVNYKVLYDEYKKLLKHMKTVVKLSDLMQLELKTVSEKLTVASQTDSLTELYNKRYFNEIYLKEWNNAICSEGILSLIMVDIDYFKKYNDSYGHLLGDECLKAVASQIKRSVKIPRGLTARFGGEEFVVLLPEIELEAAAQVAQRMVANVEKLSIEHKSSTISNKVTISVGVSAVKPKDGEIMDILLRQADNALYDAKQAGRNCFRIYKPIQ